MFSSLNRKKELCDQDHLLQLQIFGISNGNLEYQYIQNKKSFREYRLNINKFQITIKEHVFLKIPSAHPQKTPYRIVGDTIFYLNNSLYKNVEISETKYSLDPTSWHFQGYSLPFRDSIENPYYELRINPKISGHCPGRCKFCQRIHSHKFEHSPNLLFSPKDILLNIIKIHGIDTLKAVKRVLLITELLASEIPFLKLLDNLVAELHKVNYSEKNEIGACAFDIQSIDGLRQLKSLVRPNRYSFSLEFFSKRHLYMSRYKGISLDAVRKILTNARTAGFDEIQINYIAGIDSLADFKKGIDQLMKKNLVDSIGLSTFVAFDDSQVKLRHESAWNIDYYKNIVNYLYSIGLKIFHPESFDMALLYAEKLEKC